MSAPRWSGERRLSEAIPGAWRVYLLSWLSTQIKGDGYQGAEKQTNGCRRFASSPLYPDPPAAACSRARASDRVVHCRAAGWPFVVQLSERPQDQPYRVAFGHVFEPVGRDTAYGQASTITYQDPSRVFAHSDRKDCVCCLLSSGTHSLSRQYRRSNAGPSRSNGQHNGARHRVNVRS
jgi:hypothetical protein